MISSYELMWWGPFILLMVGAVIAHLISRRLFGQGNVQSDANETLVKGKCRLLFNPKVFSLRYAAEPEPYVRYWGYALKLTLFLVYVAVLLMTMVVLKAGLQHAWLENRGLVRSRLAALFSFFMWAAMLLLCNVLLILRLLSDLLKRRLLEMAGLNVKPEGWRTKLLDHLIGLIYRGQIHVLDKHPDQNVSVSANVVAGRMLIIALAGAMLILAVSVTLVATL